MLINDRNMLIVLRKMWISRISEFDSTVLIDSVVYKLKELISSILGTLRIDKSMKNELIASEPINALDL